MSDERRNTHLAGRYVLAAAGLGIISTLIGVSFTGNREQAPAAGAEHRNRLSIGAVVPVEQIVNAYTVPVGATDEEFSRNEVATFDITVRNQSDTPMTVSRAEFVPTRVRRWLEDSSNAGRTMAIFEEMDHRGHIAIPFSTLVVDSPVGAELAVPIGPNRSRTPTLWFHRAHDSHEGPMDAAGLLTLTAEDGEQVSERLTVKIRPDHLAPFDPDRPNSPPPALLPPF